MKKKFSILAALVLVLAVSLTTLAFLTAETDAVINTFTIGDINIELDEDDFEPGSTIYPGVTIDKTPIVTVLANSEPSYLYVLVDNQLSSYGVLDNQLFSYGVLDILPANWVSIGTQGTKTVYRYTSIIPLSGSDQPFTVFTNVSFADTLTKTELDTLEGKTITVDAFAHQQLEATLAIADAAALAHFGVTP